MNEFIFDILCRLLIEEMYGYEECLSLSLEERAKLEKMLVQEYALDTVKYGAIISSFSRGDEIIHRFEWFLKNDKSNQSTFAQDNS